MKAHTARFLTVAFSSLRRRKIGGHLRWGSEPLERESTAMDAVRAKLPIRIYSVENLKIVSEWSVSPGFRIVDGKSEWFGESG